MSRLKRLILEIHRRSLWQVLGIYLIGAWIGYEVIQSLTEGLGLPGWFPAFALIVIILLLPVVVATAFVQESGPASREYDSLLPEADDTGAGAGRAGGAAAGLHGLLTWRNSIIVGVLALIGLGSVGLGLIWLRNRGRELQPDVVAVMPFHVVGDGIELWREGLVDLLATALDATGEFRSSDPRAVLNRWRVEVGDAGELPEPARAAEVAGPLGAGRVVLGSVIRTGPNDLRLAADLYSVRWLHKEASAVVEGPEDEMSSLIDELTVELLKSIWRAGELPNVNIAAITTTSPAALRSYLEGEQAYRRSRFVEARNAFTRAVEADSTFAMALHRLAFAYGWSVSIFAPEVSEYNLAAARHSRGLPERDSLLILGNKLIDVDGDLAAIPLFERLTDRYPNDMETWYGLGEAYVHLGAQAGHARPRPMEFLQRASSLDSTFAPVLIHLVEIAHSQGDSVRARALTARYLALDSTSRFAAAFRLATALRFGSAEDSASAVQELDSVGAGVLSELSCACLIGHWPLPQYQLVARAAASPRFPDMSRGLALQDLAAQYLRHGRAALAVDFIRQGQALYPQDELGFYVLTAARAAGVVPADSAIQHLMDRLSEKFGNPSFVGVLALQEGRFEEAVAAVARTELEVDSLMAAGDSATARSMQGLVWAARGQIAAAHDSTDVAIGHFRRGLPMINATWAWPHDMQRYRLASLLQDRGAEEEALRIYGSLYSTPWLEALGYFQRAELHERRGEREEALRYYARFVELWADADPHLQPRVEAARRAIRALSPDR
jgi:tetratricopeptide (TPR) repeat protein